jgi:hypothetical protein
MWIYLGIQIATVLTTFSPASLIYPRLYHLSTLKIIFQGSSRMQLGRFLLSVYKNPKTLVQLGN